MWRCRLGLLQLELWSAAQLFQHYSAVLALVQLGPKFIKLMFITPIAKTAQLKLSSVCQNAAIAYNRCSATQPSQLYLAVLVPALEESLHLHFVPWSCTMYNNIRC